MPAEEEARLELSELSMPPKPPRKPSRRLSAEERTRTKGQPSWNGQPKCDWNGPELPELPPRRRVKEDDA